MFNPFKKESVFYLKIRLKRLLNQFIHLCDLGFKRSSDLVFSGIGLVLCLPLFAVIGLMVAMDGGPIFYDHQRVGRNGKTFGCLKFRTMIVGAQDCLDEYLAYHPDERKEWEQHQKLAFDPRTTAIGRFLRRTSLDELPQLLNVLKGEMSFVGPRPVTKPELDHFYGRKSRFYTSVRPGITGPWQISGRNEIGYGQRVLMDTRYALRRSFLNDLAIMLRTPAAVFSGKGAR